MEAYRESGMGFKEEVYKEALEIGFIIRAFPEKEKGCLKSFIKGISPVAGIQPIYSL